MRLVFAAILSFLLGWWFLSVHKAGIIALHAGSRAARGAFEAERLIDPVQFYAGLIFIGLLFLAALVALLSTAWDLVAAGRRDGDRQ